MLLNASINAFGMIFLFPGKDCPHFTDDSLSNEIHDGKQQQDSFFPFHPHQEGEIFYHTTIRFYKKLHQLKGRGGAFYFTNGLRSQQSANGLRNVKY